MASGGQTAASVTVPGYQRANSWTSSRTPIGRNKQMGITEKVARSKDPTSPGTTV